MRHGASVFGKDGNEARSKQVRKLSKFKRVTRLKLFPVVDRKPTLTAWLTK